MYKNKGIFIYNLSLNRFSFANISKRQNRFFFNCSVMLQ